MGARSAPACRPPFSLCRCRLRAPPRLLCRRHCQGRKVAPARRAAQRHGVGTVLRARRPQGSCCPYVAAPCRSIPDTMPGRIPCRIPCRAGYHAGYHAGQDTMPGRIPCRAGYHAGGSRARFAAWAASCLLCAIWRVTGVLCSLLGSGVGAGKGLDEASQAEGAIPIPIPIEVACQRHLAEAVRKAAVSTRRRVQVAYTCTT